MKDSLSDIPRIAGWDFAGIDASNPPVTATPSWVVNVASVEVEDRGPGSRNLIFVPGNGAKRIAPPASLLHDFIDIQVYRDPLHPLLRFARKFGPLGLCRLHHLPGNHKDDFCPPEIRLDQDPPVIVEPLRAWLFYVARLRAILNFSACLWRSRAVRPEDWAVLSAGTFGAAGVAVIGRHGDVHHRAASKVPGRRLAWSVVAGNVDYLISIAGLRPICRYQRSQGRMALRLDAPSPSLVGALALQTMLLVCKSDGLAICTACGQPYPPRRRPAPEQRTYCDRKQCKRAAHRDANRDLRRRQSTGRND